MLSPTVLLFILHRGIFYLRGVSSHIFLNASKDASIALVIRATFQELAIIKEGGKGFYILYVLQFCITIIHCKFEL